MDSRNHNQVDDNHENLFGADAVDKIKEIVDKAKTCFFCTAATTEGSSGARPMSVQEVDDDHLLGILDKYDKVLPGARNAASTSVSRGSSVRSLT